MHKLLAQWHAHDVADVLAQRASAVTQDAAIGFYNRRLGKVDVQNQTTFLWRAFGFAERLREHVQPGDPVVVACPTPTTALSAYIAAIAVGGVPLIHATRPAFEDAAAHRAAIANLVEADGPAHRRRRAAGRRGPRPPRARRGAGRRDRPRQLRARARTSSCTGRRASTRRCTTRARAAPPESASSRSSRTATSSTTSHSRSRGSSSTTTT